MSLPQKVKVSCPKCKSAFDATIWNSVNTELAPDLPQRVISGDFFDAKCPSCGFVCHLEYDVLYHDMKHGAMIWVVHQNDKYENKVAEIRDSLAIPYDITRIVHSIAELREKVAILEAGRDDRIIEIMKAMIHSQAVAEFPELQLETAEFVFDGGKEFLNFFTSDGSVKTTTLDSSVYKKTVWQFERLFDSEKTPPYAIVDVDWAFQAFERYEALLEKDAEAEGLTVEQLIALRMLKKENEELLQKEGAAVQSTQQCESQVVFCRKCGTKLLSDSGFCHKCGEQVVPDQAPVVPAPKPTYNPQQPTSVQPVPRPLEKKTAPTWMIKLLIVALLVVPVLFLSQGHMKAAFLYDVSITETSDITMAIGDTHTISYKTNPKDIPADVTWKSLIPSVALVSNEGVITAKDEGWSIITVYVNGIEKDSCEVYVTLKPVSVKNGQMIVSPARTGYPEITINAPKDANCFVYFENVKNSSNNLAFYVSAGRSATVNAPAGTYNFYYAAGNTWYGKDLKFGKGTSFYRSPDKIVLEEDSSGYDILELTLYAVPNGNMDTDPISESEFPI